MNIKALWTVFFAGWLLACGSEPSPNHQTLPPEDPAPVTRDTLAEARAAVQSRLLAYYNDLSREEIDVNRYYAPVVQRFFNAKDLPRAQVAESLQRGFETVEDRSIQLDPESLTLSATSEGYVAEFGGSMRFVRTNDGNQQAQTFRNRVVFDRSFQIISYESLDTAPMATRESLPAADGGLERAAKVILSEFASGRMVRTPQYLHPEKGFYFLTHPGAVHIPYHCTSISDVFAKAPWLKDGLPLAAAPQPGPLPDFDCGDLFSKQGCFLAPLDAPYEDISALMGTLHELELGRYEADVIGQAREVERFVSHQLVDTKGAIAFYFGQIDGDWYLLVIDIGTYDCSA